MKLQVLTYAKDGATHRVRRVGFILALVSCIVGSIVWKGRGFIDIVQTHYWESRCKSYSPDPSAISYKLTDWESYAQSHFGNEVPDIPFVVVPFNTEPHWARLMRRIDPIFKPECVIYMHEMKSRSGNDRLVTIGIQGDIPNLIATVVIDQGFYSIPKVASRSFIFGPADEYIGHTLLESVSTKIYLYFGSIDLHDPSHFILKISGLDNVRQFDGHLMNDDRVEVTAVKAERR